MTTQNCDLIERARPICGVVNMSTQREVAPLPLAKSWKNICSSFNMKSIHTVLD